MSSSQQVLHLKNGDTYEGGFNESSKTMEGRGQYLFANGSKYQGEFKENQFEGIGDLSTPHYRIRGIFKSNKAHGECIIEYANGDRYEGSMVANQRSGRGRLIYAKHPNNNCASYDGQFADDKFNGIGTLTYLNPASSTYSGSFKSGLIHGEGELLRPDYTYNGSFANSKKHGKGRLRFANGEKYEGDFENDLKSGQGRYDYPDGTSYEGSFKSDRKEGQGVLKVSNGSSKYEGYFLSGKCHGKGKYSFFDRNIVVEGEFFANHAEGQCKLVHYSSSALSDKLPSYYEGEFKENAKHGPCKFVLVQGEEVLGVFKGVFAYNLEKVANSDYGQRF